MRTLLALAPVLGLLAASAWAQAPGVSVERAWARASPGPVGTGAAYMTLTGHATDHVTGASTPVAGMAELHETIADGGVMRMRPVPNLALDPGKPVTLAPGGLHVMMMGLKHPLVAGERFPVTLTFEHAPPVTVDVTVEPVGSPGPRP